MRSRLTITALALAAAVALTGCSSAPSGKSATSDKPTVPAACKSFKTQVKGISATKKTVVTLARAKRYPHSGHKKITDKHPVHLQRLTHVAASISATPGATIEPGPLLALVVKRWEAPKGLAVYQTKPSVPDEQTTIPGTGESYTITGPDKLLWFRGWSYVSGKFQWSSCREDGTTIWHAGVFHTYGVPLEGSISCDPLADMGNLPLRHKRVKALCRV